MNSTVKKEEKKPKQGKKEKKKRQKDVDASNSIEDQEEIKKSGIFSALDQIDTKSKEETRVIEETLRAGLIKSEKSEKIEESKKPDIGIINIKNKIENLRKIKKEHNNKGRFEKAIEISNKIVTIAFSNNLKEIISEEKKFLELIKNNRYQKPETVETVENEEGLSLIEPTIPSKQVIEEIDPRKDNIKLKSNKPKSQGKEKFEEESQRFMEEKGVFKQEKLKLEEEKEAFQWEKQMLEEVKKYERDKEKEPSKEDIENIIDKHEIDEIKKFEQEKEDYLKEKANLEQQKLKFEEKREIFNQEKLKFEEEKETFKWEKQMFEEMKKHERNKETKSDVNEN